MNSPVAAISATSSEGDDFASDGYTYTREEVERVVRIAADMARNRYGKVTMIDKANVLATSRLWRKVAGEVMARVLPGRGLRDHAG